MIRICFHGAESTGKSVLAMKLNRELGVPWVPEFGRAAAPRNYLRAIGLRHNTEQQ